MADNKTKEAQQPVQEAAFMAEMVTIKLLRDNGRYKDDVFVGVNGKGWLIRRGAEVQVPRYVAQVLEQSREQDACAAELMDQESERFRAESARRGM